MSIFIFLFSSATQMYNFMERTLALHTCSWYALDLRRVISFLPFRKSCVCFRPESSWLRYVYRPAVKLVNSCNIGTKARSTKRVGEACTRIAGKHSSSKVCGEKRRSATSPKKACENRIRSRATLPYRNIVHAAFDSSAIEHPRRGRNRREDLNLV